MGSEVSSESRNRSSTTASSLQPGRPGVESEAVRWAALPQGPETLELCRFCFEVLSAHLNNLATPQFPAWADPCFKAPLFVTWTKRRNAYDELRGCIGCLEPVTLRPGLSEYALRSSLQDRRFPPVRLDEVPALTCKLSILHQFEDCAHAHDWQVGVHGVLINFADGNGKRYSATYLPEVAREHGMTREVAIQELVIKSGYSGACTKDLISRMEVTRYQSIVESVAYDEFVRGAARIS